MHGRSGEDKNAGLVHILTRFPFAIFLQITKLSNVGDMSWRKTAQKWNDRSPDFKALKNLVIGARFLDIMSAINDYTMAVLENVKYITPLRASAERYYRRQGLAVDELDPRGTNFALFLDNMPTRERNDFSAWSEKFFGISIVVEESGGHLSLFIAPKDSREKKVNIADTGFGFSQMFPILAQLWAAQRTKEARRKTNIPIPIIFAIEQPELHLHPRLQANLADVFVSSIVAAREANIDLRIIVETHSEYLVNRLGFLIAKQSFSSADASVLIFERDSFLESTSIRHATYSESGYLENWPYGFFEPAN